MPRVYDWERERFGGRTLPEPRYGEGEIGIEEAEALAQATGDPANGFRPNFTSAREAPPWRDVATYEEAFGKLSSCEGPWAWRETYDNSGHSACIHLYVERRPDQEAVKRDLAGLFDFHGHEDCDVVAIAMLRGAVAPWREDERLHLWCARHHGYEVSDVSGTIEIAFSDPWSEAAFMAHPGSRDTVVEDRRGRRLHLARRYDRDLHRALDACAAVGHLRGEPGPQGYRWLLPVPGPQARARFSCEWIGKGFRWNGAEAAFEAADLPQAPPRRVPDAFLAYLDGTGGRWDGAGCPPR